MFTDRLFFPFPGDLSKFIHCDIWGKPWERICTPGEVWNQWDLTCVLPTDLNPCDIPGSDLTYKYSHPCDPTKFIQCAANGIPYVIDCGLDRVFSEPLQICLYRLDYNGTIYDNFCGFFNFGFEIFSGTAEEAALQLGAEATKFDLHKGSDVKVIRPPSETPFVEGVGNAIIGQSSKQLVDFITGFTAPEAHNIGTVGITKNTNAVIDTGVTGKLGNVGTQTLSREEKVTEVTAGTGEKLPAGAHTLGIDTSHKTEGLGSLTMVREHINTGGFATPQETLRIPSTDNQFTTITRQTSTKDTSIGDSVGNTKTSSVVTITTSGDASQNFAKTNKKFDERTGLYLDAQKTSARNRHIVFDSRQGIPDGSTITFVDAVPNRKTHSLHPDALAKDTSRTTTVHETSGIGPAPDHGHALTQTSKTITHTTSTSTSALEGNTGLGLQDTGITVTNGADVQAQNAGSFLGERQGVLISGRDLDPGLITTGLDATSFTGQQHQIDSNIVTGTDFKDLTSRGRHSVGVHGSVLEPNVLLQEGTQGLVGSGLDAGMALTEVNRVILTKPAQNSGSVSRTKTTKTTTLVKTTSTAGNQVGDNTLTVSEQGLNSGFSRNDAFVAGIDGHRDTFNTQVANRGIKKHTHSSMGTKASDGLGVVMSGLLGKRGGVMSVQGQSTTGQDLSNFKQRVVNNNIDHGKQSLATKTTVTRTGQRPSMNNILATWRNNIDPRGTSGTVGRIGALAGMSLHPSQYRSYVFSDIPYSEPCTPENIVAGRLYFKYKNDPHRFIQCDAGGNMYLRICSTFGRDWFDIYSNTCVDGPVHVDDQLARVG